MEFVNLFLSSTVNFALGKAFNWIEERKKNKNTNVEEIQKFVSDARVKEIFQKIEYEHDWYSVDFHGSKFENDIDDFLMSLTLHSFSYKEEDSNPFMVLLGHMLTATLRSFDVQTYLYNLRNYTQRVNMPNPYDPLIEWGKNVGILDEEFFDGNSSMYQKTLNW